MKMFVNERSPLVQASIAKLFKMLNQLYCFSSAMIFASILAVPLIVTPFNSAVANDTNIHKTSFGTVQADYITDCSSGNCARTDASIWSDENDNWSGVAISVCMGTQPIAADQQIKDFLSAGFEHFGVENYKFFFEQNDVQATLVSFHVRGGTSDLYRLDDNIRPVVEKYARQANNPNFIK